MQALGLAACSTVAEPAELLPLRQAETPEGGQGLSQHRFAVKVCPLITLECGLGISHS